VGTPDVEAAPANTTPANTVTAYAERPAVTAYAERPADGPDLDDALPAEHATPYAYSYDSSRPASAPTSGSGAIDWGAPDQADEPEYAEEVLDAAPTTWVSEGYADTDTTAAPAEIDPYLDPYADPTATNRADTDSETDPYLDPYANPTSTTVALTTEGAVTTDVDWDDAASTTLQDKAVGSVAAYEDTYEPAPSTQPPARSGPASLPGLANKPGSEGSSRKHRAFQVMELDAEKYRDETSAGKQIMGPIIGKECRKIARCWNVMQKLPKIINPADEVITSAVAHVAELDTSFKGFTGTAAELLEAVTGRHRDLKEQLRRQDLDVTDAGILMKNGPDGKRGAYKRDGDLDPLIDDRKVDYDDAPESQEKTRVEFRGGLLYRSPTHDQADEPADTRDSVTHFSGLGYEIFVVDEQNVMHMASHKVGKYHHSSLLAGGTVSMAGELQVTKGKVTYLSNKSGHYLPSAENLVQLLHFLEKDQIPLDFEVADLQTGTRAPAKEFLEGRRKKPGAGTDTKGLSYEVIKTNVVWAAFCAEFGEDEVLDLITQQGWTGRGADIIDADGKKVDQRLVRRLLKQELGGQRKPGKGDRAKKKVELRKDRGGTADVSWKR
jgi:hypothetical protein